MILRYVFCFALLLASLSPAQTTRPAFAVAVWFQPPENFAAWKARGINTLVGEELGNPAKLTAEQYVAKAGDSGLCVISKAGVKAANVVGFFQPTDEPNGKGIAPATLKAAFDRFRTIDPSLPVHLSLAGDAVLNGQPWKPADYAEAAKYCDVAWVNFYSFNRNSTRYPATMTATAVAKANTLMQGKLVYAWVECDWQRLGTNPFGVGRSPTAGEVEGTVMSAILSGARGIGYFATVTGTVTSGSGDVLPGWPARYDQTPSDVDAWMKEFHPRLQLWAAGKPAPSDGMDDVISRLDRIEAELKKPRVLQPAN